MQLVALCSGRWNYLLVRPVVVDAVWRFRKLIKLFDCEAEGIRMLHDDMHLVHGHRC